MANSLVNDDEELQRRVRLSIENLSESLKVSGSSSKKVELAQDLMNIITESTSNVSSIPLAIKFVNEQKEDLENIWNQLDDGETREYLSDILALLSLMYFPKYLIKYIISGTENCLSRWGGDFMRNCSIPIARHYKKIKFGRNPKAILKRLNFIDIAKINEDKDILASVTRQINKCEFFMKFAIDSNMKSNNIYDILDMLTEAGLLVPHENDSEDYIAKWLIPFLKKKPLFIVDSAVYLWDLNMHTLARRVLTSVDEGAKRISSALHAAIIVDDLKEARRLLDLCVEMTEKAELNEKDELDEDISDDEINNRKGEGLSPLTTYKAWKRELENCLIYVGQQPNVSKILSKSSIEKIKNLKESKYFIKPLTGVTYSEKFEKMVTTMKLEEADPMERIIAEGLKPGNGTGNVQKLSKIHSVLTKLPASSALMDGFANLGMKNDAHFFPQNNEKSKNKNTGINNNNQSSDDYEFLMTFSANENYRLIGGAIESFLNYGRRKSDPFEALRNCCACLSSPHASIRAGGFLQLGINMCGYKGDLFESNDIYKNIDLKQCCLSLLGPYANRLWYNPDRKNVVNWYLNSEPNQEKKYITNLPTLSIFAPADPNDLSDPYNLAYDINNCTYPKVSRDEECCAMIALALIYMDTDDRFVKSLLLDKLILVTKHISQQHYLDKYSRSLVPFCLSLVSKCDTYVSDVIIRLQLGHSRNQASLKAHPFVAAGLFSLWMKNFTEEEKQNHKSKLALARDYCSTIINNAKNIFKPDSERELNSIISLIDREELDESSLLRYCAFIEAVIMGAAGCHSDLYEPDGEAAAISHFSFLLKSISEATGGRRAAEEEGRRMKNREENNGNNNKNKEARQQYPIGHTGVNNEKDADETENVVVEKDLENSGEINQTTPNNRYQVNNSKLRKELWSMKQLDPLTPLILGLGLTFSGQNGMSLLSKEDFKKEMNRQHLKSVNSHITPMVARVLNKVLLLGTRQCRRAAPLALLFIPRDHSWTLDVSDILISLIGDQDNITRFNAIFALGCLHSGTKNPKVLKVLRNTLESMYSLVTSFVCRVAIGMVMCGRGCIEVNPSRVGNFDSVNNGSLPIMAAICMTMGISWNSLSTCDGVMLLPLLVLCSSLRQLDSDPSERQ